MAETIADAPTGIDHLVILVHDLDDGIRSWSGRMGLSLSHKINLESVGLQQAFFKFEDGTFIELVAPTRDGTVISSILEERGEGMHVVALRVDNLEASVEGLLSKGTKLRGVGTPQVFIEPEDANGVLIQLWPRDRPHRWQNSAKKSDGGLTGDL